MTGGDEMKMNKRKLGALVLVMGLAMSSMTVCAAYTTDPGDGEGTVFVNGYEDIYNYYEGNEKPTNDNIPGGMHLSEGDFWYNPSVDKDYRFVSGTWVELVYASGGSCGSPTTSSSSGRSKEEKALIEAAQKEAAAKKAAQIIAHAETIALQAAAAEEGFADIAELQIAAEKHMSAGEYYNNAVTETFGIEEATPVAQGGNLVVDGVVTNMTATISKVDVAFVDSVRATQEGTVLNVVDVRFPAKAATINFYMPGVAADANIVALQYVDGAWVEVEVAEVRADHVVLNLKQNGKVAFIAK